MSVKTYCSSAKRQMSYSAIRDINLEIMVSRARTGSRKAGLITLMWGNNGLTVLTRWLELELTQEA